MTANPVTPRTVCVIDDDPIIRLTTQKLVLKIIEDCRFLTFVDGQQAINYFKQNIGTTTNLPQLIFVDINMPVLNGWQFLDEFFGLAGSQYVPSVYIVSSSEDQRDLDKATTYPKLSGYWIKPLQTNELSNVLHLLFNSV